MSPFNDINGGPTQLTVIMPVFNEERAIPTVAREWFAAIAGFTPHFIFLVIDDGSRDKTPDILDNLAREYGPRFHVIHQQNCGHGQSCLKGYRFAAENNIPWILQIDSDGQCDPRYFPKLWQNRDRFDVLYGVRKWRDDGAMRVFASLILRAYLLVLFFASCRDANVPYRLMRTSAIARHLPRIPADFGLANIGLALLFKKDKSLRHFHYPIRFPQRTGGEPHLRLSLFGRKAIELYFDLRRLLNSAPAPIIGCDQKT